MKLINQISNNQRYFIFLILVCIVTIIFCFMYVTKFSYMVDENNNLIFKNIPFGNGPLVYNLIENGIYSSKFVNNIEFVLQKLPVLPLLLFGISKLSSNFYFVVIIKNLITFSFIYWILYFYLRSLNFHINYAILYLAVFLVPYNLFVSLNFEFADNITSILLPSLFLVLISNMKNKYTVSAMIIFILYLTKTSMFFLCLGIPVVIFFIENNQNFKTKKKIIFLGPLFAIILWGTFSFIKTDRFAMGTHSLTVNSFGLTLASDPRFFEYYPSKSIDLLQAKFEIPKNLKSEWEVYDYFKLKNDEYLSNEENLYKYIMTFPKKIFIILFNIYRDSAFPDEKGNFDNNIRYSMIFNKLFINISIIMSLYFISLSIKKRKISNDDFVFLSMLGLSLLPLIAGWATSKHLVPISILSYFYLVHKYLYFLKK